jgi:hypothetical protein
VNFLIKPPEEKEEEIPEWLKKKGPTSRAARASATRVKKGKMGKKTSKNKEGLYGLKGPKDNPIPTWPRSWPRRDQERRHPRRAEDGRGLAHRLDLRARHGARAPTRRTCSAA